MYTVLSTRRLLFDAPPERLVGLAVDYGFDAVDALTSVFLGADRDRFVGLVHDAGLRWGVAGMPAPLGTTTSDADFAELVTTISRLTPSLAAAGVTAMSAWVAPGNDDEPYDETFRLHVRRLDAIAPILGDSGLRLALEYVGPRTWWAPKRYEFIHDLAGMQSLIAALATPGRFGLLLDTFHWFTAGDTTEDVAALTADEVLAVDLNDAPIGLRLDQQEDMERTQPGATGAIDVAGFIEALRHIGYDGPVQSEPFSTSLRTQAEERRVAEARAALRAVLAA